MGLMKKIKKGILIENSLDNKEYYNGEILNGKPHGKGFMEYYMFSESAKKIHERVKKTHHKKYSKNFKFNKTGYDLEWKIIGNWKEGILEGKGEIIDYYLPDFFTNKSGGPKVMDRVIGNFKRGKKEGKFVEYNHNGNKYIKSIRYYKNDRLVKK